MKLGCRKFKKNVSFVFWVIYVRVKIVKIIIFVWNKRCLYFFWLDDIFGFYFDGKEKGVVGELENGVGSISLDVKFWVVRLLGFYFKADRRGEYGWELF